MHKKIYLFIVLILSILVFCACSKEPTIWEVTFNANGGVFHDGSDLITANVEDGKLLKLPLPHYEGFEFLGWYIENEKIESYYVKSDIEVIAKWEEKIEIYQITYNLYGGKFEYEVMNDYLKGEEFELPIPVYDGFTFEGWYLNPNFSGDKITKITSDLAGHLTLYAKYKAIPVSKHKIILNLNGGILQEEFDDFIAGKTYKLPEPFKDEYIFMGWFFEEDFSGDEIKEVLFTGDSDINLYAWWEDIYVRRNITFNLDGGRVKEELPTTYPEGKGCKLPIPTRTGYDFVGWYDEGSRKIISEINDKATGNKTITAKWEKIYSYADIVYELNGGTLEKGAPMTYPEGKGIDLVAPKRNGYFFRGFYYESDFSGKEITYIDDGREGTLTLYAKWEETKLENAYVSFYGDSITTYKDMIPEGFANYYPAVDVQSVEDTWWHQVVTKTNSKLLMNNSYGGTAVYGGTNQGIDVNRIKLLATKEIKSPDVIIIFFGINDVVNGRTTTLFESSYTTMVESIQNMYPNAILFLCTLSYETYTNNSTPGLRDAFSEIITKIGMKKNLPIIDFKNALSEKEAGKSLGDRIHPNKSGMKLLADEAIKVVTEYFENIKEFEINYNLDGGTFGNIVPKASYKELKNSYILPIPEKTGYKFIGWYDESNVEVECINPDSLKNYSLTAKWEKITTSNEEIDVKIIDYLGNEKIVKVKYGEKLPLINNSDSSIPLVWMLDTEIYNFDTLVTEPITIKETWKAVYEIVSTTFSKTIFDDLDILNEYTTSLGKINVNWNTSDQYTVNVKNGRVNPGREKIEVFINASFTRLSESINYEFKVIVDEISFKTLEDEKPVFAYIYTNTANMPINNLTTKTIDVAHYGFARAGSTGNVLIGELTNIDNVLKLRKEGVRVLLCIGGYSEKGKEFSDIANSKELREKFASSIVETIEKYHFDGVDIDWEYPGYNTGRDVSVDRPNYTLLMEEIRKQVKAQNSDYIVSAAIPGGKYGFSRYELNKLNDILDYIHLMTYDLQSSDKTTHHTALFDSSSAPHGSVKQTVDTFISQGVSKEKLIVGIAFYGRMYTLSGEVTNILGNSNVVTGGKTITFTDIFNNYLSKTYKSDSTIIRYFDNDSKAPYIYDSKNKVFITYDDPESIKEKCKFVNENDLGGVMFWDYGEDQTFTLLNAIYEEMK